MENIEKLIIALIVFVVTSVIAYLFRMRQLYAVVPKLYRHAPISSKGSLCELIVVNKGNQVEENVQVELDADLKCELLATNSSEITLDKSTIKIERIHKGTEGSIILLVENGVLDHTKIRTVSSKAIQGKVVKRTLDVPPNFAKFFLSTAAIILFFPGLIYGGRLYDEISNQWTEYKLAKITSQGWSGLADYYSSAVKQSYSDLEFPLQYSSQEIKDDKIDITYDIFNKTAMTMTIYANQNNKIASNPDVPNPYFSSADVPPLSKGKIVAHMPLPTKDETPVEVSFLIKAGSDYSIGIVSKVVVMPPQKTSKGS